MMHFQLATVPSSALMSTLDPMGALRDLVLLLSNPPMMLETLFNNSMVMIGRAAF